MSPSADCNTRTFICGECKENLIGNQVLEIGLGNKLTIFPNLQVVLRGYSNYSVIFIIYTTLYILYACMSHSQSAGTLEPHKA